jgi:hypothetical protein
MMRRKTKSILIMMAISVSLTQTVFATEDIAKSALADASDVYLQAFYAAVATLLLVFVLYMIIFRPKIKESTE